MIDMLDGMLNPAAPPEPEIRYVGPSEGSPRLGDPDFNPKLWNQALRWR